MNTIKSYRDLLIWQKGIEIVTDIYSITNEFPREEIYALTAQMRRAAISIPSNIAEGYGRNSQKEMAKFLNYSLGSLFEVNTQIEIALNLKFIQKEHHEKLLKKSFELEKMINSLVSKIRINR